MDINALALVSLGLFAVTALPPGGNPGWKFTVVAFGASTTASRGTTRIFADRLRDALAERGVPAEVLNAGVGGNTTEMARRRFQRDVLDHEPDLVVICLGVNDSTYDVWKDPPAEAPRVSPEKYLENMAFFVREIRARGGETILMTPQLLRWTPRMKEMYGKPPYDPANPDGFNVSLRRYVAALRELAAREKVPLVDVFAAFEAYDAVEGQSADDLLPDGMHPNSQGHGIIADLLIPEAVRILEAR